MNTSQESNHVAAPEVVWGGCGAGIYFASKTKHAHLWKALRAAGIPTASTWIDEAGEGQTADYAELSKRCIDEIAEATAVLLYCEPGELLKGALVEVGAALMAGTPVLCVGECDSLSRVFRKHSKWSEFPTVEDALASIHDMEAVVISNLIGATQHANSTRFSEYPLNPRGNQMNISALSKECRAILSLLAQGYAVKHGQYGFKRSEAVRRSGVLQNSDGVAIDVSSALMEEIDGAGVPLETYEHNIAEGWKTIVPIQARPALLAALMASAPTDGRGGRPVQDFVVEIYGFPQATYLGVPSDEDEPEVPCTTDPDMAAKFETFDEAFAECEKAAENYKPHAFRVGTLAPVEPSRPKAKSPSMGM